VTPTTVHLLDHDPDLGGRLSADRFAQARAALVAQVVSAPAGDWLWGEMLPAPDHLVAVTILSGIFARRVRVHSGAAIELLGPGDLVRPWLATHDTSIGLDVDVTWQVLAPGAVALIDLELLHRSSDWPEVAAAVLERSIGRSRDLAFRHAAVAHPRVEDRLWLVLWQIAERFGRTTREGVVASLPGLTHGTLAQLVAASRPSVSKGLSDLHDRGVLDRGASGTFTLRGAPRDGLSKRRARTPAGRLRLVPARSDV
jgi:hypothetical protein